MISKIDLHVITQNKWRISDSINIVLVRKLNINPGKNPIVNTWYINSVSSTSDESNAPLEAHLNKAELVSVTWLQAYKSPNPAHLLHA